MAYYIQNPALQGFQEGNANVRQERGIFGGMMENYLTNAANYGRQLAQVAADLNFKQALAASNVNPITGVPLPDATPYKTLPDDLKQLFVPLETIFALGGGIYGAQDFFKTKAMKNVTPQLEKQKSKATD